MVRVYDTLGINDNDWTYNTAAYCISYVGLNE